MVTTEGTTFSATEVTGQALVVVDEAAEVPGLAVEPDDCVALTMRPPATPPTTSAVPSATHSSHRRGLRACLDSLTTALVLRPSSHDPHAGPPGALQQVAHGRASGTDLQQAAPGKLPPGGGNHRDELLGEPVRYTQIQQQPPRTVRRHPQ